MKNRDLRKLLRDLELTAQNKGEFYDLSGVTHHLDYVNLQYTLSDIHQLISLMRNYYTTPDITVAQILPNLSQDYNLAKQVMYMYPNTKLYVYQNLEYSLNSQPLLDLVKDCDICAIDKIHIVYDKLNVSQEYDYLKRKTTMETALQPALKEMSNQKQICALITFKVLPTTTYYNYIYQDQLDQVKQEVKTLCTFMATENNIENVVQTLNTLKETTKQNLSPFQWEVCEAENFYAQLQDYAQKATQTTLINPKANAPQKTDQQTLTLLPSGKN